MRIGIDLDGVVFDSEICDWKRKRTTFVDERLKHFKNLQLIITIIKYIII